MITIPAVRTTTPDGDLLAPEHPFPGDAIAVICDGQNYTIYQTGDIMPETQNLS